VATDARQRWVAACIGLDGPDSIRLERWPREALGAGELRVRLGACGVNFPDLLMTRDKYQLRLAPPFVAGMEAAGVVEEVGQGVTGLVPGDRVVAHRRHGLLASEAVVKVADVSRAPAGFSMSESACYRVAALTAWHALVDRARLRAGETVLVLGAGGGIGLAAVEVAALTGARVIAAASSSTKLAAARSRGASDRVDYSDGALVDKVRALAPGGVDVIIDPVGGDLFEQALRLPAWDGRVVVVGFASGRIGSVPANLPLIKGYAVLGVRAGEATRRDPSLGERAQRQLDAWTGKGHLRPLVSRSYPLSDTADALRALEHRAVHGRVVVLPPFPDSTPEQDS
jgi:NADPH:quinone reductase